MEKETKQATQAAIEANISASNAKDIFNDMCRSFEIEIANVQHISLQLQESLIQKKDLVQSVANEACKTSEELIRGKEQMWLVVSATQAKNLELNELLQRESSNIAKIVAAVQKDRDVASQAAQEAKCSALKASEMLAEVLKSFNEEMTKARHMSMQLLVSSLQVT
jgi:hypothetical protein